VTFGEYAQAWLVGRKVRGRALADRTRDGYQDLLDAHILPTFSALPLTSITSEMVDHWYELCAVGRPTTQARAYSLLRTILGTAVDRNLIEVANPAKIRGGGSADRAKKVKPASLAELEALAAAMPDRHRLMVMLASWCALRFGELAELRRGDIDTKAAVVRVRRGVVRTRDEDDDGNRRIVTKVKSPKSDAGVRDVAIPPHLLPMVREHLLQHAAPGRDGLLFPGADGEHIAPSSLYGKVMLTDKQGKVTRKGWGFYEARHVAGRDDLRFHDLRHTGAVLAAQTGATLAELMGRLGHSTPSAALRYQHAAAERDQEIARRLSAMAGHPDA
jgi:integrase